MNLPSKTHRTSPSAKGYRAVYFWFTCDRPHKSPQARAAEALISNPIAVVVRIVAEFSRSVEYLRFSVCAVRNIWVAVVVARVFLSIVVAVRLVLVQRQGVVVDPVW